MTTPTTTPPDSSTDVLRRNNVRVGGAPTGRPIVFAHGYGCDQAMWRWVEPILGAHYPTVLFDHVGAGDSDLSAYDYGRYDSLDGYADDIVEIVEALDLHDAVLVGHSVGAMIGALAATRSAGRIGALVLVSPSPRFIDDPDDGYVGGFSRSDIDGLLETLSANYLGWSLAMAPTIMGAADRPELTAELANSFCRTDPAIAEHFATVTFLSDNRHDLAAVPVPTLVLQASDDALAPVQVGQYIHEQIPGSQYVLLDADGHCPHVSAVEETVSAIVRFLQ